MDGCPGWMWVWVCIYICIYTRSDLAFSDAIGTYVDGQMRPGDCEAYASLRRYRRACLV